MGIGINLSFQIIQNFWIGLNVQIDPNIRIGPDFRIEQSIYNEETNTVLEEHLTQKF